MSDLTILSSETHEQLVTFGMVKIYEYCVFLNIRWKFCPNWLCEKFKGAFKSWSMLNIFHRTENCKVGSSYIQVIVLKIGLTNECLWCQWLIIMKNNQEANQLYRNGTAGQVHSLTYMGPLFKSRQLPVTCCQVAATLLLERMLTFPWAIWRCCVDFCRYIHSIQLLQEVS
jgi:hypothetical protein